MVDILVVDDEILNRKIIGSIIRNNTNYNTTVKTDGEDALNYIRALEVEKLPDIILVDIKMPKIDGFQFLKELKKDTKTSEIPVIFITVLDDFENKLKAFKMGGVDYISKPFNKYELLERLNVHLRYNEKLDPNRVEMEEQNFENIDLAKLDNDFLSGAFHDLQNPVSIIQMYSTALMEEAEDVLNPEMKEFLKIITQTSEHMEELIKDIFFLMKLKSGKTEPQISKVNFQKFLNEIIDDYDSKFKDKNIKSENNISDEVEQFLDADLIEIALRNILEHIFRVHNNKGEIGVALEKSNNKILIKIIFFQDESIESEEDYFKASANVSSENGVERKGFKLGISKEIIEKHNGEIYIESSGGNENTIIIELPDGSE